MQVILFSLYACSAYAAAAAATVMGRQHNPLSSHNVDASSLAAAAAAVAVTGTHRRYANKFNGRYADKHLGMNYLTKGRDGWRSLPSSTDRLHAAQLQQHGTPWRLERGGTPRQSAPICDKTITNKATTTTQPAYCYQHYNHFHWAPRSNVSAAHVLLAMNSTLERSAQRKEPIDFCFHSVSHSLKPCQWKKAMLACKF